MKKHNKKNNNNSISAIAHRNKMVILSHPGIRQYDLFGQYAVNVWVYPTASDPTAVRCFIHDSVNNIHGEVTDKKALNEILARCSKKTLVKVFQDAEEAFNAFERMRNFYTFLY